MYSNIRPAKSLLEVRTRFDNVELIIVGEYIEDTYGGIERIQTAGVSQGLKLITRPGSIRIASFWRISNLLNYISFGTNFFRTE